MLHKDYWSKELSYISWLADIQIHFDLLLLMIYFIIIIINFVLIYVFFYVLETSGLNK